MRISIKGLLIACSLAASVLGIAPKANAADPSYLMIGVGSWETLRSKYTEPELDLSYRSDYKLWIFKPHAGMLVAKDGDFYGYGGLLTDIYWGKHIVTTLSTAVGGYGGGGFRLGSHVEFRSGVEAAYRFEDKSRLGVGFYHISNAGLTDRNPGSESLMLEYAYPIGNLFSQSSGKSPAIAKTQFSNPATYR